MKKAAIIAALTVCSVAAKAEFYTGNDLLQKLDSESVVDRMVGVGYVIGVFDTAQGIEHCPTGNVVVSQIRDMVRQHLVANPETRHHTADLHVRVVLKRAWPCAKKNSRSGGDV